MDELTIGILDCERHESLIKELHEVGARVHLVPNGDLSVALVALDPDSGVEGLMNIGGAPEGPSPLPPLSIPAGRCKPGGIYKR
jgi:fructose-1,6-bisphosphatase II